MADVFLKLLNMSLTAGWLVLAVMVFRLIFNRAPKWLNCLLWGVVGIRLLMPFSLESIFSLVPSAEPIPQGIQTARTPTIDSGIPVLNSAVNPILSNSLSPNLVYSANPMQIALFVGAVIWIAGVCIIALYGLISYILLRKRVSASLLMRENIYYCDNIDTPFILGVIRPKIYIPSGIGEAQLDYVLKHENAHIKRKDYLWKPIGFVLLAVYWFNPLIWVAYILLCRDIEAACDQRVVKNMDVTDKKGYSEALLACSIKRRMISACPVAFGETGVKGRIKSVLNYKRPAFWLVSLSVVVSIAVAVCFLPNPKENENSQPDGYTDFSNTLTVIDSGSEVNGVSISVKNVELEGEKPYLEIEWKNERSIEFVFGEMFDIYYLDNGEWISCVKEEVYFNALGYVLKADSTYNKTYYISQFDLSKAGNYRFRVGETKGDYLWIDFSITKNLSLEDVEKLSEKGEKLSWDDFEQYPYVETGSGLYIRHYEINQMFYLLIGGGDIQSEPMYIYLCANDGTSANIDIRTDDVRAFVNAHKDNMIVENLSAGWYCCPVGYSTTALEKMRDFNGILQNPLSSVTPHYTVKITSVDELTEFISEFEGELDFSLQYTDTTSFEEATKQYDAEFFKNDTLLLRYIIAGSSSYRYTINNIYKTNGTMHINITEKSDETGNMQMQGWLMAIAVSNSQIKDIEYIW